MILFMNDKLEVHAVNVNNTDDKNLTPVFVDETKKQLVDIASWPVARICCYKMAVSNGIINMITPYVDSNSIPHFDQLGRQVEDITPYKAVEKASAGETEVTFVGVPEGKTLTTVVKDLEGNFIDHNTTKSEDIVKVFFEPLTYAADITLSIN